MNEQTRTTDQEIAGLKLEVQALKQALGTLIAWLPQVAGAPINVTEASRLLDLMEGVTAKTPKRRGR